MAKQIVETFKLLVFLDVFSNKIISFFCLLIFFIIFTFSILTVSNFLITIIWPVICIFLVKMQKKVARKDMFAESTPEITQQIFFKLWSEEEHRYLSNIFSCFGFSENICHLPPVLKYSPMLLQLVFSTALLSTDNTFLFINIRVRVSIFFCDVTLIITHIIVL